MQISLASVKSYLALALLLVAFSVSWANAQSVDIEWATQNFTLTALIIQVGKTQKNMTSPG